MCNRNYCFFEFISNLSDDVTKGSMYNTCLRFLSVSAGHPLDLEQPAVLSSSKILVGERCSRKVNPQKPNGITGRKSLALID